jgi:hypothetical protein
MLTTALEVGAALCLLAGAYLLAGVGLALITLGVLALLVSFTMTRGDS